MSRRSTCDHSMIWLVETGWPSATRRAWSTARWTWPWGRIGRSGLLVIDCAWPRALFLGPLRHSPPPATSLARSAETDFAVISAAPSGILALITVIESL